MANILNKIPTWIEIDSDGKEVIHFGWESLIDEEKWFKKIHFLENKGHKLSEEVRKWFVDYTLSIFEHNENARKNMVNNRIDLKGLENTVTFHLPKNSNFG